MCWCSLKFLLSKKLIIKTLTKSLLMDDELFFAACLTDERNTAQKMKFSMKGFFSEYDEILRNLRIWSHLLKKSFMENFIFCTVAISLILQSELLSEILTIANLWHPQAGLERAQNLSSGFVEWSCAVVLTTTLRSHRKKYFSPLSDFLVDFSY